MHDLLLEVNLLQLSFKEIVTSFMIVSCVITTITLIVKKIIGVFNGYYQVKAKKVKLESQIEENKMKLEEVEKKHNEDYTELKNKLDTMIQAFNTYVEDYKKDNQVKLRNDIHKIYKETLRKRYILEKDDKDYHYMIERYKANGGNSYVIDEIEPRMKKFKVVLSDEDVKEDDI